ncbi:MAG: phage major capsid protein [Alphaproteobacteria bacterium]|nr:phage major capsid protein [Alphaproteobacteria bacterium]
MSNSNYNDIFTTTLESRTGKLADNVSDSNALLSRLREKKNIRPISGGSKIVEELEYGEGDLCWYNGFDSIAYTPKQLFTAAEYSLKLCAVPVAISGEDMLKNSGREQIIDLFEKRIENAMKTMKNKMSSALYGDGTENGGKTIGGLALLVANDPTVGTVGGIDRATAGNEYWRNQTKILAEGEASLTKETIRPAMEEMFYACSRGVEQPDLIVADDAMYSLFEQSLEAYQRFTDSKVADAGFKSLKFKGADVILDGGQGGNCPQNTMYFLNTNYLYLRPHKDRNMKVVGGDRMAVNQDALYRIVGWAGNLTMSNASCQGVLKNI